MIYALSREIDHVYCSGRHDTVFAYSHDIVENCARVIYEESR